MKGAKKSELDSEHVLDISKIFLADNLQCCVTFCVIAMKSIILIIFGNNILCMQDMFAEKVVGHQDLWFCK